MVKYVPPTSRRWRFWQWVHALAIERLQEIWSAERHADRRCPNCGRWYSLHGWTEWVAAGRDHDRITCAACGHTQLWLPIGMGLAQPLGKDLQPLPAHPITRILPHG